MAAGDLNWTDAGKTSKAQFFYDNKKGKRMVGKCGDNEVRTGLMVRRSFKIWVKLFKLVHKREPYQFEINEAITTKKIGDDVAHWEKLELIPQSDWDKKKSKKIGKKIRRQERVLRKSLEEMEKRSEKARQEAEQQREYEESISVVVDMTARSIGTIKKKKSKRAKKTKTISKPKHSKEDIAKLVDKGFDMDVICIALGLTEKEVESILK